MIQQLTEGMHILTKQGYIPISQLTNSYEVAYLKESGELAGFTKDFTITSFRENVPTITLQFDNGSSINIPQCSTVRVKGKLRWKTIEAKAVQLGDLVRYGGNGSALICEHSFCQHAWFFSRFVENGYGNGSCYCWNSCYDDVIDWLTRRSIRWTILNDTLRVEEKDIGVKWNIVKDSFGEWLWCKEFRDEVGWGLDDVYNGEGIVVDVVEGEGRKIVIECEGLVIALFCLVRWKG